MGDKVKRWRQKAANREEWVSVIKEAKTQRAVHPRSKTHTMALEELYLFNHMASHLTGLQS